MRFDKLVEERIREAMEAGEFDNIEGKGRPVNLDAYFATPEELRAGYSVLKNAGIVPEEAQILKEIAETKESLKDARPSREHEALSRRLRDLQLRLDLLTERNRAGRRPS